MIPVQIYIRAWLAGLTAFALALAVLSHVISSPPVGLFVAMLIAVVAGAYTQRVTRKAGQR